MHFGELSGSDICPGKKTIAIITGLTLYTRSLSCTTFAVLIAMTEPSTTMNSSSPEEHIAYIFQLLEDQGKGDYLGESISQLEHCLQAAYFAEQEVNDEDAIIAALLHDIGQFLPLSEIRNCKAGGTMIDEEMGANVGRHGHDVIGQRWLLLHGWPRKVASLVGAHVTSKRYVHTDY